MVAIYGLVFLVKFLALDKVISGPRAKERGASGRLSVAFGGSANLFSHSVLPFFLTRGRQHLCAAKPKSILPVLVSRRPAASALHTALEGTF